MRAPVFAWTSCTVFAASPFRRSACSRNRATAARAFSARHVAVTALRRSCCPCKIWVTVCWSSIISLETAPGAEERKRLRPGRRGTLLRVRAQAIVFAKECLLGEIFPRPLPQRFRARLFPACASNEVISIADASASGSLVSQDEVRAAVLLPARFVVLRAERTLFAPAHRFHPVGGMPSEIR